jgi:hypothetical protein
VPTAQVDDPTKYAFVNIPTSPCGQALRASKVVLCVSFYILRFSNAETGKEFVGISVLEGAL